MSDPRQRIAELARILNGNSSREATSGDRMDPASRGLRAERLRTLTQHLHDRMETDADEVDSLAMRLLLDEYAAAVADLRATLRDEAAQVATAAAVVNDVRKLIGHRREQQEKRLSSVAPSDPPPAS